MSKLSRRGFVITLAGVGGATVAGAMPALASSTPESMHAVHGVFKWWSKKRGFGHFVDEHLHGDDVLGALIFLKPKPRRVAGARPFSPEAEKVRHLIVPGERVTLLGPSPFDPRAQSWQVSAIMCAGRDCVAIETELELDAFRAAAA